MAFADVMSKAKDIFKKRGGAQAAKEDAAEVKDIAQGEGSAAEKAEGRRRSPEGPRRPRQGRQVATPTRLPPAAEAEARERLGAGTSL